MAEENIVGKIADGVGAETTTAPGAEKKKRAARRPKTAAETVATAAAAHAAAETPAKAPRAKRGTKAAEVKPAKNADVKKSVVKAPRTPAAAKKQTAPAKAFDDIAELIKLEEENKSLRKQLATKLRDENADLRKRLGQK